MATDFSGKMLLEEGRGIHLALQVIYQFVNPTMDSTLKVVY